MKTVKELQGIIAQKQFELAAIFEKSKKDDGYNMSAAEVEDVRSRNAELTALGQELDDAKSLDDIYQKSQAYQRADMRAKNLPLGSGTASGEREKQSKSLGALFVESAEYKGRLARRDINVSLQGLDVKTLFETTAGFAPESVRTGKLVEYAVRRPVVADLIPQTGHDQAAVVYMEETTLTNGADTTAEAAPFGESALEYTQRTEPMYKITTFLPVTDEQLKYVQMARSLIDNRLTLFLRLAQEAKLLGGTGGGVDIDGFLHKSGVQSQAKGADPIPDAIYKAMTKVRATGMAEPSAFVMHPNDWQDIRLLRTTDGIYIWGSPSEPGIERIWGLPGVITTAATENTALLGDFQLYSELFLGGSIDIKVSDSHSDYFVKGKQAIRADMYCTLAIYRAAAFCKVTGI